MGPVQLTPTTLLRLAPGARVLVRGRGALQFGLDATRSGIVETPVAEQLAPALEQLYSSTPAGDVLAALGAAGASPEAARSLLDDLIAYRVVVAGGPAAALLLVGSGPLYDALSALLRNCGVTVRTALASEPYSRTLSSFDPSFPVAFVDELPRARDIARQSRHRSGVQLPVSAVDARVFIGPLGLGRSGPCLYCAHLYHRERDDQWEHVVGRAAASGAAGLDPVTVAAGAAAAATVLRRVCGVPDPPGVSAPAPARGELIVVDPYAPVPQSRAVLGPHPGCPVCY